MTGWPDKPVIYRDSNTRSGWALCRGPPGGGDVADVPASAWTMSSQAGADAVWMMGVWERSPGRPGTGHANAGRQASFRDALPDVRRDDVIGSPYCVSPDVVDRLFGGTQGLANARRSKDGARGVGCSWTMCPTMSRRTIMGTTQPELWHGGEARIEPSGGWVWAAGTSGPGRTVLRRGPMWCSWTRSALPCARRRATLVRTSPGVDGSAGHGHV